MLQPPDDIDTYLMSAGINNSEWSLVSVYPKAAFTWPPLHLWPGVVGQSELGSAALGGEDHYCVGGSPC